MLYTIWGITFGQISNSSCMPFCSVWGLKLWAKMVPGLGIAVVVVVAMAVIAVLVVVLLVVIEVVVVIVVLLQTVLKAV